MQNYYQAPSENRRRNRRINPGIWSACGSPVLHLCYDVGCFSVTVAEIIAATAVTEQAEAEEAYGAEIDPPYANAAQTAAEAAEAELNATQAAAELLDRQGNQSTEAAEVATALVGAADRDAEADAE